jgi:prepilin-type N-terminal cleavage/methylation domain-containing protein
MFAAVRGRSRGITLLELLVVLMILSIILTAAVKTWDVTLERGRAETTWRKLNQLATAMVGDPDYIVAGQRADFGFVGDVGRLPDSLRELVVWPFASESSRWRGPYIRSTFNESPEAFRIDGWGDTIIWGRRRYNNNDSLWLRSRGGRAYLDPSRWQTVYLPYTWSDLTDNTISGQVVDVRGDLPTNSRLRPGQRDSIITVLKVILYQPSNGVLQPLDRVGLDAVNFAFSAVPQGTHRLEAWYVNYYDPPAETLITVQYVPVYPGIGARDITLRMNVDWDDEPLPLVP